MAVVPTALTLTPTFENKQVTVDGVIAVNERVALTVVGVVASDVIPDGLTVRITSPCGRVEYARFPFDEDDVWGSSGDDATATLILNTTPLQTAFWYKCADDTVDAKVWVENGAADNLYATSFMLIHNWVQNPVDPVAGSSRMQTQIDTISDLLEVHQHDTDDGTLPFAHNNLSGRNEPGVHPGLASDIAGAQNTADLASATANTASSNASTALNIAQGAKGVTDLITDGGGFATLDGNSSHGDTKSLVNQIVAWLNIRRGA